MTNVRYFSYQYVSVSPTEQQVSFLDEMIWRWNVAFGSRL